MKSLAQELYPDFAELQSEREITDSMIAVWVSSLSQEKLASGLSYASVVNPKERGYPLWFAITHFSITRHIHGQLTTLLSQRGINPGVTDLIWLPEMQIS